MNSNILAPTVRYGAFEVKNLTGGEIDWDKIVPTTAEGTPTELLYKLPSYQIREEMEKCKEELREVPAMYTIENGVFKKNIALEGRTLALRERLRIGYLILNRRSYNRTKKVKTFEKNVYEVESVSSPMNRGVFKDYTYEVIKGDKMENKIYTEEIEKEHWIHDYIDENGQLVKGHVSIVKELDIQKECVVPYSREGGIKKKDILLLHRNGRLGIRTKRGKIRPTNGFPFPPNMTSAEVLEGAYKAGMELFVILPKGGRKSKEYGAVPYIWTDSSEKRNIFVPLNQVVRKIYKPEIDGKTPRAKEFISEFRGDIMGYAPVYTYDELEHVRDFVPELLSFNYVEYSDKVIIVLGTKDRIERIDRRLNHFNKVKYGYHKFTKERTISYSDLSEEDRNKRSKNSRIVPTEDEGVQVFGLNLRGTPEEDLKGYLRGFDRIAPKRNNEEVKELLEIAQKQDGRQSRQNIEHDLRNELKYLRTRSSKELYFLILGIEEESSGFSKVTFLSNLPGYIEEMGNETYKAGLRTFKSLFGKKEEALIGVLESFKSSKEIEENEGKGLTSDINDLVTIEEGANDSSYKKSKNLFSQQMGILNRNQNPLKMKNGFTRLGNKKWRIKGGPISIPSSKPLPKRNIKFVQRKSVERIEIPLRTMFIRGFEFVRKGSFIPKKQKVEYSGIEMRRGEPLFHSSFEKEVRVPSWKEIVIKYPVSKRYPISKKKETPKVVSTRTLFRFFNEKIEECIKEYRESFIVDYISKKMKLRTQEPRVPQRITGLKQINIPCDFYKRLSPEKPKTRFDRFKEHEGKIPTVRLFDDRTKPETVWKRLNWKQFNAYEQKPYQYGGKVIFQKTGEKVSMKDGSVIECGEYVRIPHNHQSIFKILHTIGDGKGGIDFYIIEINGQELYAKGDLSLLDWNKERVSFTGTRKPNSYTKKFVQQTVKMFSEDDPGNIVTVSGGAEGCDTLVHKHTIRYGEKTILVLAGGFNGQWTKKGQVKPEAVLKNGGLLLSEHPPEYKPNKKDFVLRNKIIAGLSERLVVFQAGKGTLWCAKFGFELGKTLLIQGGFKPNNQLIERKVGKKLIPAEGYYPF